MGADDSFEQRALRRHRRYQEEIVERYAVCPWAKSARQAGRVRAHVVADVQCDATRLKALIDAWADDEACDVAFIILPRFDGGMDAFDQLTAEVGELRPDEFLSAPFHPGAPEDGGVIRFLRQTPDPTIQLVRRSRLDEVRSQDPAHYQDIFSLDLDALKPGAPARTVAASVLAHNTRLVATHREAIAELLRKLKTF